VNYLKFPLNHQSVGTTVEVTLSGVESDVFIVDNANLAAFERGAQFRYVGGHYRQSPVYLGIPSTGTWTVVVIPGIGGSIRATVRTAA
jgi:hypothetical protein